MEPDGEDDASTAQHIAAMKREMARTAPDVTFIPDRMIRTFSARRKFIQDSSLVAALEEYPALTLDSVVSSKIASDSTVKLDDVGDALHHALDEVICGSSQFKQLVPDSSFHVNRTVAITVFPDTTYWVVLNTRWNTFVFKNFGYFTSRLCNAYYKDASTVAVIKQNMVDCDDLWTALSVFQGNETYDAVEHIKVVVKQLTDQTDWH